MKKIYLLLFCTILFAFFISSCNPIFYAPTIDQTPLFRQKGETQAAIHIDDRKALLQAQAAHAFDSNLAFFSSFYAGKRERESVLKDVFNYKYNAGMQVECAIGYFKTRNKNASYEFYGGSAFGKINGSGGVKSNFIKPFAQGNIGYRSKIFDFAFSMRLSYLHIGITDANGQSYSELQTVKSHPNSFLIEPGVTLRLGFEPIKAQVNIGLSINNHGSNYPQESGGLSFGLVYMFNSAYKKPKKPHLNF